MYACALVNGLIYRGYGTYCHVCVCVCVFVCFRNYAIADYLQSQGYGETLDSFRKELDTVGSPAVLLVVYGCGGGWERQVAAVCVILGLTTVSSGGIHVYTCSRVAHWLVEVLLGFVSWETMH